jgi:hypothetical protein
LIQDSSTILKVNLNFEMQLTFGEVKNYFVIVQNQELENDLRTQREMANVLLERHLREVRPKFIYFF